jgi:hypothetical protein
VCCKDLGFCSGPGVVGIMLIPYSTLSGRQSGDRRDHTEAKSNGGSFRDDMRGTS